MALNNQVHIVGIVSSEPRDNEKIFYFSIMYEKEYNEKIFTEYFNVKIFGEKLIQKARMQIKKGVPIYVQGCLSTSSYEKDGIKKYSTEIKVEEFHVLK